MKQRRNNPSHVAYKQYGGHGIKVCDEWSKSFETFYHWAVSHGYTDNLSIDRIDNTKGYSPENCRWATNCEQQNNKRSCRLITAFQKTLTVAQWARETGIKENTIRARLLKGMDGETALRRTV
jgi:hypothetical protein